MFSAKQVRNQNEGRSINKGQDLGPRPLSLTCSPALTWLYVTGNPEAAAIVDAYQPRFKVRTATPQERAAAEW